VSGRKPNRFHYSHTQEARAHNSVCLVKPMLDGEHFRLTLMATLPEQAPTPTTFWEVLMSWGNSWLWDHVKVTGGDHWIYQAITEGMLVAVTDGSYIQEIYPDLCLAAFVLKCSKGRGRIYGVFTESSRVANAYRGELLGLMAIHLILLSVNKIRPQLSGSVEIVSDCLGTLKRVTYLPSYRIPLQCRHSDILKTILVHCRGFSFTTYYSHVKAHQDNNVTFAKLSRKSQLNCICNHTAKH
jgi:hypothetical protein